MANITTRRKSGTRHPNSLSSQSNHQMTKFIKNCVFNNILFPFVIDGEIQQDTPPISVQEFAHMSNEEQGAFLDNLETMAITRAEAAKNVAQPTVFVGKYYSLTYEDAVRNMELIMQSVDTSEAGIVKLG